MSFLSPQKGGISVRAFPELTYLAALPHGPVVFAAWVFGWVCGYMVAKLNN
jgi:hypothetical protein